MVETHLRYYYFTLHLHEHHSFHKAITVFWLSTSTASSLGCCCVMKQHGFDGKTQGGMNRYWNTAT